MKLGLLQCDHVSPSLTPIAGDYDAMFRRWLAGEWVVYDLTRGERPRDLAECDAFVATGSRASVYQDLPWIRGFADLVREIHAARQPFLGVCFGHQMMAHALGGRVTRSPRGVEVGVRRFPIARAEEWMVPARGEVAMLMSCEDQVDALPPESVVLAGDERCPVAIYRTGRMLGIQGHPEWSPAFAEALMSAREEGLGADEVARARRTLTQAPDGELLASWAGRFLETAHAGAKPR